MRIMYFDIIEIDSDWILNQQKFIRCYLSLKLKDGFLDKIS